MNWKIMAAAALFALAGGAGAVGRLADVTVYDRAEGRTLPVYRHEGRYYVVGVPGNEYEVRVRNRTGAELLGVVSVDGINAVSGETADWSQTGYVLAPRQAYEIRGWRKSTQRTAAFFFTEHRHSYAARTGRPDHAGVIGVAIFRKKAEPEARLDRPFPPRAESPGKAGRADDGSHSAAADAAGEAGGAQAESADAGRASGSSTEMARRRQSLGTGHGRSEASPVTYTSFERATTTPEEVTAIHYDTRANLVALGVIPAARGTATLPSPFPGNFVPDPL